MAFMKAWLKQCITNEAVRQTVLDLGVLKALNGAVILLKRQNGKRSSSRFSGSSREDSKCTNLLVTGLHQIKMPSSGKH